jgi:hypothetical protein
MTLQVGLVATHKLFCFQPERIWAKFNKRHVIGDAHGCCGARNLRGAGCVGTAFVVRSVPAAADQISSVPIQTVKQHQPTVAIPARRLQGF